MVEWIRKTFLNKISSGFEILEANAVMKTPPETIPEPKPLPQTVVEVPAPAACLNSQTYKLYISFVLFS